MMTGIDEKESLARAHLPYRAEYCKTSRARCKKCDRFMQEDTLKLANLVKSRFHDGYDSHFYHTKCFFLVKRPCSIAEIRHFETLRHEDQKMLEKAIETRGQSVLGAENDFSSRQTNISDSISYEDFLVEYAKSSRSKCVLCDQKIDKQSVRLGKMDFDAETQWGGGPVPRWFHPECFNKSRSQLEFNGDVSMITNFYDIDEEDQKLLIETVRPLKRIPKRNVGDLNGNKRSKKESCDEKNLDDNEEDRLLRKQSDRFFDLRSAVATMKRKDIELLMSHMNQKYDYKNISILIDMATDVLLFGPIQKCPECKQTGGMQLRGCCYICTKSSEWAPCSYETREPRRYVPNIPDELIEKYEFFDDKYKFQVGKRIFPSKFLKAIEEKEAENNSVVVEYAPLDGITIGVTSWKALTNKKAEVLKKVKILGGNIVTALDRSLFVILSNEIELETGTPKIEVAKNLNVPFATDDFLFKIKTKNDLVEQLSESLIGKYDGDLNERYMKMNVNQLKQNLKSRAKSAASKSIYKSSRAPKSQILVVKDGTAVDPDSNLAEVGRVYRKGNQIYNVVLNSIDVTRDKNSFYKMQVIEHETRREYYLYRSWGRIGCEVGGSSCKDMDDADDATSTFEKLFEEKTGNPFASLMDGNFKRVHGLYFPIEVDYSDANSDADQVKIEYNKDSKLEKSVQELICFIFDIQRMHKAMKRFELDTEKMPLGKLSERHIFEALETLKELQQVLEVKPRGKPAKNQLVALTNKFYSFIPQSFGDGQVQLISNMEQVKDKSQMLAELLEIELAYRMCSTIRQSPENIAVDQYYMKLNCGIGALDCRNDTFRLISEYVSKTHAVTHNNYKLNVTEIFKVHREADMKRFTKHKDKERHLLWHGSRVTNFAGILSQGLRVAPPEAPSTGFMFGKGIYFADMSSKAANYCMADPVNSTGLLLLCEVALGKMHDMLQSDEKLPKGLPTGCESVRGLGKSAPDYKTHVKFEDDIIVPIGKQVPNKKVKSQLLYNEYVVYDESQTMLRFIVKVNFEFK